jgi:hypothetical protein
MRQHNRTISADAPQDESADAQPYRTESDYLLGKSGLTTPKEEIAISIAFGAFKIEG